MENRKVFRSNLFVLVIMSLYLLGRYILSPIWAEMNMPLYMYLFLPEFLFIFIPIVLYFVITKEPIKEVLRLKKLNLSSFFIVVGIGFLIQPVATLLSLISQYVFPNDISQIMVAMVDIPLYVKILVIAVTPALFEELSMRGVVLKGYEDVNIHKAALITGFFFGIMHMNGQQFLYAFGLGILFAYIVKITDSIFSSIIIHFIVNGSQTLLSHYLMKMLQFFGGIEQLSNQSSLAMQPIVTQIMYIVFFFILALVCAGIIYVLMLKLIEVNNSKVFLENNQNKENIRIFNWPFVACIVIFLFTIITDLISIYG